MKISAGGWRIIRDACANRPRNNLRIWTLLLAAEKHAHKKMRSFSRAEQQKSFHEHGFKPSF
jgi:hypothetical protein